MSKFVDPEYDDVFYEMLDFLKSHKVSELLYLVQYTVEWLEEENDERSNR